MEQGYSDKDRRKNRILGAAIIVGGIAIFIASWRTPAPKHEPKVYSPEQQQESLRSYTKDWESKHVGRLLVAAGQIDGNQVEVTVIEGPVNSPECTDKFIVVADAQFLLQSIYHHKAMSTPDAINAIKENLSC